MYSDLFQVSDIYSINAYLAGHTRIKKNGGLQNRNKVDLMTPTSEIIRKCNKICLDGLTNLDVAKRSDDLYQQNLGLFNNATL